LQFKGSVNTIGRADWCNQQGVARAMRQAGTDA